MVLHMLKLDACTQQQSSNLVHNNFPCTQALHSNGYNPNYLSKLPACDTSTVFKVKGGHHLRQLPAQLPRS